MSAHFSPDAFFAAGPAERRTLRSHAERCDACRGALLDADPTAIFAFLAEVPVAPAALEGLTAEAILRSAGDRPGRDADRRGPKLAAIAAAVAMLALLLPWSPTPPERAEREEPRANVAVLESPGSPQVVDLTVGETQIVMIFAEGIDL